MPVEYKRTENADVFLEIKTQSKDLSLVQLEAKLAALNKQIGEVKTVPTDKVTPEQKAAIEFYNMQTQDMVRHIVDERDRVSNLITTLKALPVQVER